MQRWMEYADAKLEGTGMRCFVCPGNDDMFEIDAVIAASKRVAAVEGKVIQLDEHHEMANSGWSNPTPWHTHREEPEEALLAAHRGDDRPGQESVPMPSSISTPRPTAAAWTRRPS